VTPSCGVRAVPLETVDDKIDISHGLRASRFPCEQGECLGFVRKLSSSVMISRSSPEPLARDIHPRVSSWASRASGWLFCEGSGPTCRWEWPPLLPFRSTQSSLIILCRFRFPRASLLMRQTPSQLPVCELPRFDGSPSSQTPWTPYLMRLDNQILLS
jgi:hypothetical protein